AQVAARLAEAQGKSLKFDEDQQTAQKAYISDIGDQLAAKIARGEKPYDPMSETSKKEWDGWVAGAKKRGIPLPPVPDTQPDGSSKVIKDILTARAANGPESTGFQTKKALLEAPGRVQQEIHAATDASAERRNEASNLSREEIAQIKADAAAAKQRSN